MLPKEISDDALDIFEENKGTTNFVDAHETKPPHEQAYGAGEKQETIVDMHTRALQN